MAWFLNLAYLCAAFLVSPWLLYRRFVLQKRLGDWRQKFLGSLPVRDLRRPCIWLHAVSVGEVVQLRPVLQQLSEQLPGYDLWITTTTTTGHEVARKLYPQHTVCYFPFDFSWSVARALDRLRPATVVLVELELWPNFIAAATQRQIPVVLINGRVSDQSYRSYRWIRPLLRRILPQLTQIAVQNQTYAQRLIDMGADPQQVIVTGSIKFDGIETRRENVRTQEIRSSFGLADNETIFIAGSTQAPEEELALSAYLQLRSEFPRLRLILVPRHKERFEEVAAMVERHGVPLMRRSKIKSTTPGVAGVGADARNPGEHVVGCGEHSPGLREYTPAPATLPVDPSSNGQSVPVLLLDTLGELSAAWGLADIAFVGGSLTRRGGQNMIEPAGYGAAVLFGPHTRNFKDVVALLLDADAARVVPRPEDLLGTVREMLENPVRVREMGDRAQQLVTTQTGATSRTVELIVDAVLPCSVLFKAA